MSVLSSNVPPQDLPDGAGRPMPLVHSRNLLAFFSFVAAFYFAYRYGMSFSQAASSPFWFPDSVLLCALLKTRVKWWWLPLLATLPIRLLVEVPPDTPLWFLISVYLNDCGKAAFSAYFLRHLMPDPLRFRSLRQFGAYCAVAVVTIPMISGLAGAAARHEMGNDFWTSWMQWILGDATANLIVTPFFFYWVVKPINLRTLSNRRWLEAVVVAVGTVITTWLAFQPGAPGVIADSRFYAPVPFIVWAAIRFTLPGATAAMLPLTIFSVAAAISHSEFAPDSPSRIAAELQEFLLLRAVPLYIIAILLEQMHRAERSLRESEQRFRYLADSAPVFIWTTGPDKLCEFTNKHWLEFTGRTQAQELGNGWAEGMHPDDFEHCFGIYVTSFDARRPFEMEYRIRHHTGAYRWVLDRGVPRYAPNGDFLGYIGTAIDVTDRHAQQAALKQSEERYREVVETQSNFVCRFLPDTTLTFVNQAYCRFLGKSREELLGTNLISLFPRDIGDTIVQRLASANLTGEATEWEGEIAGVDDGIFWQHWTCHAILDNEGVVEEFQAIGHDITDRKRLEEMNRQLAHASRLAAAGELTAMVAHEINQPLSAILHNAEAAESLLQSHAPPLMELREIVADIRKDDLRAGEVVRSIRALTNKREMQLQPMDLNQLVANVVRLASGDALRRRVNIKRHFAADLPLVRGDIGSLEQVLLNLIVNAMDAMQEIPESSRRLSIETRRIDDGFVEVAVTDTGHGVSAEKLPHLFDSFFTTKRDGMGLGLSIARSIVQAHQGRIWAESSEGAGTVFRFTLRIAETRESDLQHPDLFRSARVQTETAEKN